MACCYDIRDENFRTVVVIDLWTFLPVNLGNELAGEEIDDNELPDWRFVIEAMTSVAKHQDELWEAWWIQSRKSI